jgi:hypothetical protein
MATEQLPPPSQFISIKMTNESGFVDVPGDPLKAVTEDGEDAAQFANFIKTVFDGDLWSVDVEFVNNVPVDNPGEDEPAYEPEECVDFNLGFDLSEFTINLTKINNTKFTLAGPSSNVFPDEFYQFKMADYSIQILPPTLEDPFFSLIRYQMPQPVQRLKEYDFKVLYVDHTLVAPSGNWRIWNSSGTYNMRYTNSSNNIVVESFSTLSALQTRYNQLNLPFENWSSDNIKEYDINQWFFWKFQTAVNNIAALVVKGLK